MGFDVTATHVVFFVAFLTVGSAALGGFWKSSRALEDARRDEAARVQDLAHTNMTVSSVTHAVGPQTLTVHVVNTGSVVLDHTEFAFLLDGVLVDRSALTVSVLGAGATDLLLPTETLVIEMGGVAEAPSNVKVVAGNGAAAYWSE